MSQVANTQAARDEQVAQLRSQLDGLTRRAESISIYRPLHCYRALSTIGKQMANLEPAYSQSLKQSEAAFQAPPTISIMPSSGPTVMIGRALSGMISLQWSWNELSATRDRKAAFSLAILSLYVSLISLLVSGLSLLHS
jgi:hypothetical protein